MQAELTTPDGPAIEVSARDRRARVSASAAFAVQGLCFAAVISQVPVFKDKFGLDENQLTITLAAVPVIAGVGSVLAGVFAPRIGSGMVLRLAALGVILMTAATGLIEQRSLFYGVVALFGFFLGAVDATMNMQGTAVQRRYGRSILASCHAWWSVAAIAGALGAIVLAKQPEKYFLVGAAVVGLLVSLIAAPGLLKKVDEEHNPATAAVESTVDDTAPAVRRGWVITLIGIALMIMFIGDAATTNWSGIFLDDALHAGENLLPAGLFAYLVFQLLGRVVADRVIGRLGAIATVIVGGIVAAAGFGLVAISQRPLVAIAGFAVVGLGLSVVVPLTFSAADALDPAGTGSVIAKVNLFNYAGVIVGSAVIGVVADPNALGDLRLAFVVPAVLVLLIIAFAPAFRVVDTARARSARVITAR